jgi:hypothetical protein
MKARYAVAFIALLAIACSSVHPVAVQVGERCYRCRRAITDTKLAAQLIDNQGAPFPFRTSGCLAKYLKSHPEEKGAPFVADNGTGHFVSAASAWFVPTDLHPTESQAIESDFLAFGSRKDAEAANTTHATLLRWDQVIAAVN